MDNLYKDIVKDITELLGSLEYPMSRYKILQVRPRMAREMYEIIFNRLEQYLYCPVIRCIEDDMYFRRAIYWILREAFKQKVYKPNKLPFHSLTGGLDVMTDQRIRTTI